jgi:hypothetical protein
VHTVVDLQTCLTPQYVEHFWLGNNFVNSCGIATFRNIELAADKASEKQTRNKEK